MKFTSRLLFTVCALFVAQPSDAFRNQLRAADAMQEAAAMLPESVVLFAELNELAAATDLVRKHPLRQAAEELPPVQAFFASPDFQQFLAGLRLFEAGVGQRWPAALKESTDGGVFLALDAQTEGLAVMAKATNPEIHPQILETILPLVRGGIARGDDNDPIVRKEFQGVTVRAIRKKSFVAIHGDWFVFTNKPNLMRQIVLRMGTGDEEPDGGNLAESSKFGNATRGRTETNLAWGFLDVATIRESGEAPELYSGKTDNPLAEILFGGIMSTLQHTPYVSFDLQLQVDRLTVALQAPHSQAWVGEERAHFFGADGQAKAIRLPDSENQLFAMNVHRDLSEMWLRAGDLMTEQAVEGMAQADSQLAIFFSGKDFGEDILGAFDTDVQLLVTSRDFAQVSPSPAIKLPAFGLNFRMKTPEVTTKEFRRVFQSLIGFLNVVGVMNGSSPFDMDWKREENRELLTASYASDLEGEEATAAPIQYNFEPTVIFEGDQLAIGSTEALAEQSLAPKNQERSDANTLARLRVPVLRRVLDMNREQLIAQNMLEKGHSREAAEAEIGLLLILLRAFGDVDMKLIVGDDQLTLQSTAEIQTSIH